MKLKECNKNNPFPSLDKDIYISFTLHLRSLKGSVHWEKEL